jgi:hypothetical protein
MNAVTLTKKHFNGDGVVLDKGGEWISNGHWALHSRYIKNFAIFKDEATVKAALGEPLNVRTIDVGEFVKGTLSGAGTLYGKGLVPFKREPFIYTMDGLSGASNARVYQREDGGVTFIAERYTFDVETLYGTDSKSIFTDDPALPGLVVMPIRIEDKEASPFILADAPARADAPRLRKPLIHGRPAAKRAA